MFFFTADDDDDPDLSSETILDPARPPIPVPHTHAGADTDIDSELDTALFVASYNNSTR